MQYNRDAISHVIVQLSPASIGKRTSRQQVASGFTMQGMVPQAPNEIAYGDDHGEQPLQLTKQICNAKRDVEL